MGSTDDIEDLSENYDIDLPTAYSAYIAVIFEKDAPYFDDSGWTTLIVFTVGFFMILPFVIMIGMLIFRILHSKCCR